MIFIGCLKAHQNIVPKHLDYGQNCSLHCLPLLAFLLIHKILNVFFSFSSTHTKHSHESKAECDKMRGCQQNLNKRFESMLIDGDSNVSQVTSC